MSRRKAIAFRLAAVLLGLLPLLLLEGGLTIFEWGESDPRVDPWISFTGIRPLFVFNPDTDRYEIAASRQGYFRPDSFRARKGENEYRVFALGGSTVQGNPWGIETSFTTWLELSLQAADPTREWEVVNCGGISYASYRLVPILEEVLQYQPDLIVVYTGQNEFLEDREYATVKHQSTLLTWLVAQAARTRTFHAARRVVCGRNSRPVVNTQPSGPLDDDLRPQLPEEVAARLDFQGGLAKYHRDDVWRDEVERHYEANLRRMVRLCRSANVPLVLMNPVCNLRDCPPFKSEHRPQLSERERQQWEEYWSASRELFATNMPEAIESLRKALAIDDQHAGLHYELAKCLDSTGKVDEARIHYELARDHDICPLRIRESMHRAVWRVVRETQTPCVDARAVIAAECRDGIPGGFLLVDHVHPSIKGHQLLAQALLEHLVRQEVVEPRDDWQTARDQAFQRHYESLDSFYFMAGQRHLHALRNWAAGRATRLPGTKDNTAQEAGDTSSVLDPSAAVDQR